MKRKRRRRSVDSVSMLVRAVGAFLDEDTDDTWQEMASAYDYHLQLMVERLDDASENRVGKYHTRNGQDTEKLAAFQAEPGSGTKRLAVLQAIAEAPDGLTDLEIAACTPMVHSTVLGRRNELMQGGWIVADGERLSSRNRWCKVWVLTPAAEEFLARR